MSIDIFKLPQFKSWIAELSKRNVKIAVAAEFSDGKLSFLGNTELGLKFSTKPLNKRESLVYVGCPVIPCPNRKKQLMCIRKTRTLLELRQIKS